MTTPSRKLRLLALAFAFCASASLPALASKERFVIDLVSEPSSLDPQVQWNPDSYYVYRNIFDNLVARDEKGEIVPQVATSWKYLSDTQISFEIRNDILFHDGKKLTPEDVAFSVQRITDPKFASPQLGQFDQIVKAEVTGPNTVTLTTKSAYPALLAQLVKLSIVPKHVVDAVGKDAFNTNPVGSGPYQFDSWQRGVQVTLKRNDAYWGPKGPFPVAVFRAVPDAATRLANLQAGTSDLGVTLDSDQAAQLKTAANAQPLTGLTERVAYLRLNTTKPPFNDARIRQAAAYAIDKEGIVDGILGGFDKPVNVLTAPPVFGYADKVAAPGYDLAKAKALVAEVGPGAKAEIELATSPVFDQRVVQAIQQMLGEAGLTVTINMSDMASYLKRAQAGPEATSTLSFGRWSCACQDADGILFPLLHKSSGWSAYRNPEADKLLEEARQTLDKEKRLALYRQVHDIVAKEVPLIPLYQSAVIYGATKHLKWQPTANESMFLNQMAWTN